MAGDTTALTDFLALVEVASLEELRIQRPVGRNEFSSDVMVKTATRPPVGVQGMILDAMDDERLTVKEAAELLRKVQERLGKEATDGG
jgi:hypothetical protein